MLGASYSLELSEQVLSVCRSPEETEDIIVSDSSKNVSRFAVLEKIYEDEI